MDLEPSGKDFGTVNPEQKQEIASDIYDKLQEQRRKVCLSNFGRGDVIYPDK